MDTETNCIIAVVDYPQGMSCRCQVCNRVLISGQYPIGVILESGAVRNTYFVGAPEVICCGEKKNNLFLIAQSAEEGSRMADEIRDIIARTGDTSGLELIDVDAIVPPDPNRN